jgi:hypothetical protein
MTQTPDQTDRFGRLLAMRKKYLAENPDLLEKAATPAAIGTAQLNRFGYHNFDYVAELATLSILPKFLDENNRSISLTDVAVVCRDLNTIQSFSSAAVNIFKGQEIMIIGLHNGDFTISDYIDSRSLPDTIPTPTVNIKMKIVKKEEVNYQNIRKALRKT